MKTKMFYYILYYVMMLDYISALLSLHLLSTEMMTKWYITWLWYFAIMT